MKRPSRLAEIAAAAGVSTATVSRALKRPELVNEVTRAAVIRAAEQAGYDTPAQTAAERGLLGTIGLVVPDIENPFFSVLTKAVLQELRRSGTSLIVADTNEEPLGEGEIVGTMLPRVDGLIVASSRLGEAEIAELATSKPMVLVNREIEGIPSVVIDYSPGCRQAVEHLAALGHERIAYVEGPAMSWSNRQRRQSFEREMAELGLTPMFFGPYAPQFEGGVQAADIALAKGITAIVAYNDLMAFGIMSRLASRGVGVPDRLSVIGFDDVPAASIWSPPLSTVTVSTSATGRLAAQAAQRMIAGKGGGTKLSRRLL
ncbi:MAG: LacI family DNA-binding transcriptional regulator, partial [Rhizobiales bacterium]|nr:LacI family DNA-binding transcriptional regulator [Hyphomicrobiales bacterium]